MVMRSGYNPFSKPLSDIAADDLLLLKEVYEGWFVDYKSQPLPASDFGKHLSAFANQFGGWLFIGIDEGRPKTMKAAAFPGVPKTEVDKILIQLRQVSSAHLNP